MATNHVRGVGSLVIGAVDTVVAPTEGVHRAVARRTFRVVGPVGVPVRTVHDAVAGGVYSSLRLASRVAGAGVRAGVEALAGDRDLRVLEGSDRRLKTLAILNAAFGDRFEAAGNDLAIEMQFRHGGRRLRPDPDRVATRVTAPTGRVAVFVHGLAGTERDWCRGRGDDVVPSYGDRLGDELGFTPIFLRYNTGRHISDNGRDLAALLDRLVAAWPVPVDELALIGHSMGGLVLRSACHQGDQARRGWVPLVRHAVYLGSPHRGAPLEKLASRAVAGLGAVAESRPFAELADVRSAGIKDLRFGYLREEDWRGGDVPWTEDRSTVPLLASATHGFVAATLHRRPDGLSGGSLGDLLVPYASAAPAGWVDPAAADPSVRTAVRHVGGLGHFDLLHHPGVYDQIREWLEGP